MNNSFEAVKITVSPERDDAGIQFGKCSERVRGVTTRIWDS